MKTSIQEYIYNIAQWMVVVLGGFILAYLTILVLGYQFNATDSIPISSNLLLQFVSLIGIAGGCLLLGKVLNPHQKLCKVISVVALFVTLIWVGTMCVTFVSQTRILPGSDPGACFTLALQFLQSDFKAVVPEGSYLSLWPFQTSFIFVLEKLMRIFNVTSPLFFQRVNCIYILMIIACGYGIVCALSRRIEARLLYLMLMATYGPLFFKSVEVYGDVPSLAWMMCSLLCFVLYYKCKMLWCQIFLLVGFGMCVILSALYKSNCLIYVIAFMLVVLVQQFRKKDIRMLVAVIITALLASSTNTITQKYYEHYAGNTCGKGVPSIAFVAMGLQYINEEAIPGGWNGFHANTYMELEYDYDKTVERSKESIRASMAEFAEKPDFAIKFFHNKVLKQWANQTQGTLWGINGLYDTSRDRESFWVLYLEYGKYHNWLSFMDVHQSLMYGILWLGCMTLLVDKVRKREIDMHYLLPLVTLIGGFLFSLIWEGQTDAVMYYPVLLLPMALVYVFRDRAFPADLQALIADKPYTKDSIGMSGAGIYIFEDMVLKVQKEDEETRSEAVMLKWLAGKVPVPEILYHRVEKGMNYLLMSKIPGVMSCEESILGNQELVTELLAEGLKLLWSVDISDCPQRWDLPVKLAAAEYSVTHGEVDVENVEPETFGEGGFKDPEELLLWLKEHQPTLEPVLSHGDYCLPNIFVEDGRVSGFIDLGKTGIADKWQDIALCYRSLKHNYTGEYGSEQRKDFNESLLFEKLGLEPDWEKIRYYILMDELF